MMRWRRCSRTLTLPLLLSLAASLAAAREGAEQPPAPPAAGTTAKAEQEVEPESGWRTFVREDLPRLLVAVGVDQAASIYSRSVGPSTDPLIFEDPPRLDEEVREALQDPNPPKAYVDEHGLETLRYGAPLGLIFLNLGDGRMMARDLLGFVETFYTNQGLTSLLKEIVGRERPYFEYADPNDLTPEEYEEMLDDPSSRESFPSGHASGSFAFASYLERSIAREIGLRGPGRVASFTCLYGLAGYIGYTRIRNDKHYFTDVVAGAALGTWVGRTYYRLNHREEYAPPERRGSIRGAPRIRLNPPQIVPGGVAVTASIRLGADRP